MVYKKIINGVPIPLQYITPNLQFYPLIIPSDTIYMKNNNDNNNDTFNNANININLTEKDHLIFVNKLMNMLNINYTIIGNFLIDLTRKDFELNVDYENDKVSIKYQNINKVKYINEKCFKKNFEFLKIDKNLEYNNSSNDNSKFINYHCNRIISNTLKIKNKSISSRENFIYNKRFF